MKKNQLTTTRSTSLILGKSKSLMGITKKLLEGKNKDLAKTKVRQEITTHKDITLIGDLMWQNEPYTQAEEDAYGNNENHGKVLDWDSAMEYAKNLSLGGYDDWRLPSIEELKEVVTLCGGILLSYDDNWNEVADKNLANISYLASHKTNDSALHGYWSSTAYDGNASYALDFYYNGGYGLASSKSIINYVRCVRGGKPLEINEPIKINKPNYTYFNNYDVKIYEKLKILRAQIASERGIPNYIVFSDKTLKDMADKVPKNKEDMLEVHGIGEVKFERYGKIFLKALQSS